MNYDEIIYNIIYEEYSNYKIDEQLKVILIPHSNNDGIIKYIGNIKNDIVFINNFNKNIHIDICIFYNQNYSISIKELETYMNNIKYGIFVIDTCLLQNKDYKRRLLKYSHIIKLIYLGTNNIDDKDYCLLICENINIAKNNLTNCYDLSNIFKSSNIETINGMLLDYYLNQTKYNVIELTDTNNWLDMKEISISDINNYILEKHKKYLQKCYLVDINDDYENKLLSFSYNKCQLSSLLKAENKFKSIINILSNDLNKLYPKFEVIKNDDKLIIIRYERLTDKNNNNIIQQKITIYKLLKDINDINVDVIGYQIYRYLLKGYDIENSFVYVYN